MWVPNVLATFSLPKGGHILAQNMLALHQTRTRQKTKHTPEI